MKQFKWTVHFSELNERFGNIKRSTSSFIEWTTTRPRMYEWMLRTKNKRTKVRMYEIRKWTKQPTNQQIYKRMNATNYKRTKVRMYEIQKWTKQPTNPSTKGMNYDYKCCIVHHSLYSVLKEWYIKWTKWTNEVLQRTSSFRWTRTNELIHIIEQQVLSLI